MKIAIDCKFGSLTKAGIMDVLRSFIRVLKTIVGFFCVIMAIVSFVVIFEENEPGILIESLMFAVSAFFLFRRTEKEKELAARRNVSGFKGLSNVVERLLNGFRSADAFFKELPKGIKYLLSVMYFFVMVVLFGVMLNTVNNLLFNIYITIITISFMLFLIWMFIKGIVQHLIHKAPKETAKEVTPAEASTPAPVAVKKVDENKVRSALMLVGSEFYSANLSNFICEQRISISLIQRRLKVGFNHATVILDTLQEQGLISSVDAYGYEWTEKALLRSAEGLNG